MREIQILAGETVTLLCDGKGCQPYRWIGQSREHHGLFRGRVQQLADRADHTHRVALTQQRQREQMMLWRQRIAHFRAVQGYTANGPVRISSQQIVQIRCLMRAVEGARSEVHDADTCARRIVGRACNGRWQAGQRGQ